MKSVMHDWGHVPQAKLPRSVFDLSNGTTTTFNSGYLVPVMCGEVLPGDTWNLKATVLARLQTLKYPLMDNLYLDMFAFYVPNRLLWEHWEQFQGERRTVAQIMNPTEYLMPVLGRNQGGVQPTTQVTPLSLSDYIGLPISFDDAEGGEQDFLLTNIRADWHRAYYQIYNAWFRDQNLIDPLTEDISDGPDLTAYTLQRRAKRRDYFTSCLPWPQKGPEIELPLGDSAPILGTGYAIRLTDGTNARNLIAMDNTPADLIGSDDGSTFVTVGTSRTSGTLWTGGKALGLPTTLPAGQDTGMYAKLSDATASTINSLRLAFQLQRLLERDARGGTRYIEQLKSHWGVTAPDFRLQRPELLGMSSAHINVHPVQQTSESATTPQGHLTAFAMCADHSVSFVKGFVEHGVILVLANVRADLRYQQGVDRMFLRRDRYDFYMPVLAGLGEQLVTKQEIYADGINDNDEFGWIPPWDDYRFKQSRITGLMRSGIVGTFDVYHLAQELNSSVVLGKTFIEENPPLTRVIATSQSPEIFADFYFDIKCAREMPTYGVPGLIDHF